MTFTTAVMLRTRTVSKYVSRFLFVGRMEKKKEESARQDKLETTILIVQAAQLKVILGSLLWTDSQNPHISSPWPLLGAAIRYCGTIIHPVCHFWSTDKSFGLTFAPHKRGRMDS